ncbi:flagellar basal body rod C-terminal domain-containing protein [Alicyclobacillus dauci]|uniref:Flagellar basal body rod protein n=1 Tax=Alicyclobacillus dauci TaxID=1475485 RepID=A0ABY6Z2D2_9BACL|nr:flagellar basal body rod C-terminal domain-containing protein [Alicyclobacillus dauci]WAH36847.1 flagellar basal body rod protein [Alicyclobacillus dauci]
MNVGLTTAAAGMQVNERIQQLLANNLANQATPGFKVSNPEAIENPVDQMYRGQNGTYSYIGNMGTGVTFQEGVPDFSAGTLSQTGRALDVAITDTLASGQYAAVQGGATGSTPMPGVVTVGNGGRLGVNGQALAVFDANGQPVQGVYAVRNPNYRGTALTATASAPDYDAGGNPSYLFANAQGQVIGVPGQGAAEGLSIRVGNQSNMGYHSFYPVHYVSSQGQQGIALTKSGSLQVDSNNTLVDSAGNVILPVGANGQPIQGARIVINPRFQGPEVFAKDGQPVTDSQGQASYTVVNAAGQPVPGARLGTVDADVTQLSPLGQTEYMVGNSFAPATVLPQLRTGTGQLQPGQLEESNVDPTTTMTLMLNAVNSYEANQRVIQTEDSLLQTATTDIGKVNG